MKNPKAAEALAQSSKGSNEKGNPASSPNQKGAADSSLEKEVLIFVRDPHLRRGIQFAVNRHELSSAFVQDWQELSQGIQSLKPRCVLLQVDAEMDSDKRELIADLIQQEGCWWIALLDPRQPREADQETSLGAHSKRVLSMIRMGFDDVMIQPLDRTYLESKLSAVFKNLPQPQKGFLTEPSISVTIAFQLDEVSPLGFKGKSSAWIEPGTFVEVFGLRAKVGESRKMGGSAFVSTLDSYEREVRKPKFNREFESTFEFEGSWLSPLSPQQWRELRKLCLSRKMQAMKAAQDPNRPVVPY